MSHPATSLRLLDDHPRDRTDVLAAPEELDLTLGAVADGEDSLDLDERSLRT